MSRISTLSFPKTLSYGVLLFSPLFFSSNILFGKVVIANVEPWTLAFVRWGLVSLILFPFVARDLFKNGRQLLRLGATLGLMGFLGMWICGAIVYYALRETSATNAILIYLSSPVIIIIIEASVHGRRVTIREIGGIVLAVIGVLEILLRGDIQNLISLAFNIGDLAMVFAAAAWAVYSVLFKSDVMAGFSNVLLLCLFSAMGALMLAPFAAFEMIHIAVLPLDFSVWLNILGIIFSSSIVAFLGFQHAVRFAGPAIAGIFMYLLPVYGVGLAVLLLGEKFEIFHLIGILTILGGVMLATFPTDLIRRRMKLKGSL